ncbi:MAG: polyphosphate kinase 1 [Calditrichia bacterium]
MNIRNKELSWLSFNARLLQEASDTSVPLIERIKFLGIFSSNLDEFFRVRVATLKRLTKLGTRAAKVIGQDPTKVLKDIHRIVLEQQQDFDRIYLTIIKELEREKIFIIDETGLNAKQQQYISDYFRTRVRPALVPIMLDQLSEIPLLKDHAIYLAVRMSHSEKPDVNQYAVIEVPDSCPRFVLLPQNKNDQYLMLLDDVIRFSLGNIFSMFDFDTYEAYTIKLTRDAELEMDDDISQSFLAKVHQSLKKRKQGKPVRFIFDSKIPAEFLDFLLKKMKLNKKDSDLIPGSRYHNFKDFMRFPKIGSANLINKAQPPLPHPLIDRNHSLFRAIDQQDILLTYPYQSFNYVLDLLREAAIDPYVTTIRITLYRVASDSNVINALINAAKNGKSVKVTMELQARFDEQANIAWSQKLREEGVKVVHGLQGLKVHAKLILISRKIGKQKSNYLCIGTGNYNESTAKVYSDHTLFTCDARLTGEVRKVFDFLESSYKIDIYRHLFVSPFNMRKKLIAMINTEIVNAKNDRPAWIFLKLNNLTDPKMIKKLYKAAEAGVKVRLMVRGMFSAVVDQPRLKGNMEATGMVDQYLEHSRIMVFCNGGEERYFLTSADWMPRNLDTRVEVACPIYDPLVQREIRDFMEIHWSDNCKSRLLDSDLQNRYRKHKNRLPVRAQTKLYRYFEEKLSIQLPTDSDSDSSLKAG